MDEVGSYKNKTALLHHQFIIPNKLNFIFSILLLSENPIIDRILEKHRREAHARI